MIVRWLELENEYVDEYSIFLSVRSTNTNVQLKG